MRYFKLGKLKFKHLIDDMAINRCVQVTLDVTLKNVTLTNNLLLNSYFENPTVGLLVLYILNTHANFHANRM